MVHTEFQRALRGRLAEIQEELRPFSKLIEERSYIVRLMRLEGMPLPDSRTNGGASDPPTPRRGAPTYSSGSKHVPGGPQLQELTRLREARRYWKPLPIERRRF